MSSMCLLAGMLSLQGISFRISPERNITGLTLETNYSGVGPADIEISITKPLEERLASLGGIQRLYSVSEEGRSRINLDFEEGLDLDLKTIELRESIEPQLALFPREVQNPVVYRYDPNQKYTMVLDLDSDSMDLNARRRYAENVLKKKLQSIKGIGNILVAGGEIQEIVVSCDSARMQEYRIPSGDILRAIRETNLNRNTGSIRNENTVTSVYYRARLSSTREIENLTIKEINGNPIHIGDVAKVEILYKDADSASRINTNETVSIYIYRGPASSRKISSEIKTLLTEEKPANIITGIIYDESESILEAYRDLILLFAACLIILFLTRAVLLGIYLHTIGLVLLNLLTSISTVFFLIFIMQKDMDAIIFLFIIVSGLLNVAFQIHLESHRLPIIKSYIVTIIAIAAYLIPTALLAKGSHVPVLLPGIFSAAMLLCGLLQMMLMSDFKNTSYLLRITIPPVPQINFRIKKHLPIKIDTALYRLKCLIDSISKFQIWQRAILIVLIFLACLILANFDSSSIASSNTIQATVEMPSGSSFDSTNKITKDVEKKLKQLPEIDQVIARVESGQGRLQIKLKSSTDLNSKSMQKFKEIIGNTDPAFVYFAFEEAGIELQSLTVDVFADDLKTLDKTVRDLARKAEKLDGITDVVLRFKSARPERQLHIDRSKAESSQLSPDYIGESLRISVQGGVASKMIVEDREMDIRVRFDKEFRSNLENLKNFKIRSIDEWMIPVSEVVEFKDSEVPVKIYRRGKKRVLSFSIRSSELSVNALSDQIDSLKGLLPPGYRMEPDHNYRSAQTRKFATIGSILIFLLLLLITMNATEESLSEGFHVFTFAIAALTSCLLFVIIFNKTIGELSFLGYIILLLVPFQIVFSKRKNQAAILQMEGNSPGADETLKTVQAYPLTLKPTNTDRNFSVCVLLAFTLPALFYSGTAFAMFGTIALSLAAMIGFATLVFNTRPT